MHANQAGSHKSPTPAQHRLVVSQHISPTSHPLRSARNNLGGTQRKLEKNSKEVALTCRKWSLHSLTLRFNRIGIGKQADSDMRQRTTPSPQHLEIEKGSYDFSSWMNLDYLLNLQNLQGSVAKSPSAVTQLLVPWSKSSIPS